MARHHNIGRVHENLPRLLPGDEVPRTGKYWLEGGTRVKPKKKMRATRSRSSRMKKIRGFGR